MQRFRKKEIAALTRGFDTSTYTESEFSSEGHVQKVVNVKLSEEACAVISDVAARVYKASRGQLSSEANYRFGLLGQCSDALYLFKKYDEGLKTVNFGEPDLFDIEYMGFKFEVKTFRWTRPDDPDSWMAIPLRQFNNSERLYPFYIANQGLEKDEIRILGFMHRERVKYVGSVRPCPLYKKPSIRIEHLKEFCPIRCLDCELHPKHRCLKWDCDEKGCCTLDESNDPYNFNYPDNLE